MTKLITTTDGYETPRSVVNNSFYLQSANILIFMVVFVCQIHDWLLPKQNDCIYIKNCQLIYIWIGHLLCCVVKISPVL